MLGVRVAAAFATLLDQEPQKSKNVSTIMTIAEPRQAMFVYHFARLWLALTFRGLTNGMKMPQL